MACGVTLGMYSYLTGDESQMSQRSADIGVLMCRYASYPVESEAMKNERMLDMVCAVERKLSVDGGRIGVSGWEKRMMGMERDPSLSLGRGNLNASGTDSAIFLTTCLGHA